MFDNLRVYFENKELIEEFILKNKNYKCKYDKNIDSVDYPIKYNIENLIIVIDENYAYLENSIHKYYNKKTLGSAINFNDFTYCKLLKAFDKLALELDCYDFHDTKISNLEFGFNLRIPIPAAEIIRKNILLHKYKTARINEDEKKFSLKKFRSGNYEFKIYDKAFESDLDYNLIRIELIFKAKELKRFGMINICDLYEPQKVEKLFNDFLKKFNHLIIIDDRFNNNLKDSEVSELGNMLEPSYWQQNFGCNKTRTRRYQKLKEHIIRKNLNETSLYLKEKLKSKFDELFTDCEGLPIMND